MCTNNVNVVELPAVVITQVLSELDWKDKLNVVVAIKSWEIYLDTPSSWPTLNFTYIQQKSYRDNSESNSNDELLDSFVVCLEKYGKNMKCIEIIYNHENSALLYRLLSSVLRYCFRLITFGLNVESNNDFQSLWIPLPILHTYFEIIKSSQLIEAKLKTAESAIITQDFNLFNELQYYHLENKFKSLELGLSERYYISNEGLDFKCLKRFQNLKYLEIDQINVDVDILLDLIKNKLTELTLCQEDDSDNSLFIRFNETFWKSVKKLSPCFCLNLLLINVDIVGSHLSPSMPLKKLTMNGMTIAYTLTHSVLTDIGNNYHKTLKSLCLHNSYFNEMTDSTIEVALLSVVEKCEYLEELHYDYPIDSATVLLLAKLKKFKNLQIISVEVNYVSENQLKSYPEHLLDWLKHSDYGYGIHTLESSVSDLLGYKWCLKYRQNE